MSGGDRLVTHFLDPDTLVDACRTAPAGSLAVTADSEHVDCAPCLRLLLQRAREHTAAAQADLARAVARLLEVLR